MPFPPLSGVSSPGQMLYRLACRFAWLLRRAAEITYEENCLSIAKGAAYSGLVALFPVLGATAAVLVEVRATPVLAVLSHYLSEVLPPGTQSMVLDRFAEEGSRPTLLLIAAVALSVHAASGFMMSLIEGFNAVYHVPAGRPFLRQRGVAALLVLVAALPTVGASILLLFGDQILAHVHRWVQTVPPGMPIDEGVNLAWEAGRVAIAVASVVLVTGLLYFIGPNRPQRWHDVWPGAWVGTALWLSATAAFAWYVGNIAQYSVMYGTVGAVIALLGWIYLISVAAFVGCAFNAAIEQSRLK